MRTRLFSRGLAAGWGLGVVVATATLASAETHPFALEVPDFLIPLDGRSSTLDIYADGRAPKVTGYNVLGSQSVFVRANGESSGRLTLNLNLPALLSPEAQAAGSTVENPFIQFTVSDLDLFPDTFAAGVTLRESAAFTGINGVSLSAPVDFVSLLPAGTTTTDEHILVLNQIRLTQPALPAIDYTKPFTLTFTFTATAAVRGSRSYTLANATEQTGATFRYTLVQVPEPSVTFLLVAGAAGMAVARFRRRD